jgi:putative FmdB family regulatory protein
MPIYEYEPTDHDCLICSGRVEALQGVNEPVLEFCPTCGMPVRRVISKASIAIGKTVNADKAAAKGFTTFRRAQKGVYEKVGGEGPDTIEAPNEATSPKAKKIVDLDG